MNSRAIEEIGDSRASAFLWPALVISIIGAIIVDHCDAGFVTDNWSSYSEALSKHVLDNPYSRDLFEALPALRQDPSLISAVVTRITHDERPPPAATIPIC